MGKYTEFYRTHHKRSPYGRSGKSRIQFLTPHIDLIKHETMLDWGAGSRLLELVLGGDEEFPLEITSYDACVEGIDTPPEGPFDVVVTTDVLEHIPYDEIDDVLAEIIELTGKRGIHFIPNFPAHLILPDGENAHLIQEDAQWWKAKFEQYDVDVIVAEDTVNAAGMASALIVFDRK